MTQNQENADQSTSTTKTEKTRENKNEFSTEKQSHISRQRKTATMYFFQLRKEHFSNRTRSKQSCEQTLNISKINRFSVHSQTFAKNLIIYQTLFDMSAESNKETRHV